VAATADALVVSDDLEGSAGLVVRCLEDRGAVVLVLETSRLANNDIRIATQVEDGPVRARVVDERTQVQAELRPGSRIFRRQPAPPLTPPNVDPGVAVFVNRQYRSALNSLFSLGLDWMNDAAADGRLDQNKIYGNLLARDVGLTPIPTVLTNDPTMFAAAVSRWGKDGDICLKSPAAWAAEIPGEQDVVTAIYSVRKTAKEALGLSASVSAAPVLVQPYIEKQYELRVTIVAQTVFACRIDSQASERTAVDWRRYDFDAVAHEAYELPKEVDDALLRFTRRAGLQYVAVDLIRDQAGRYLFVEANPAGQFGWIESLAGLPISASIADWLLEGRV
jgi:glutathione synthase/RimK-type ligase-like ATP-grasp enzyme